MIDVFISYNQKDVIYANKLYNDLSILGLNVWYDQVPEKSPNWRDELAIKIAQAGVVVTLWSPNSVTSKFVRWESELADKHSKQVEATLGSCSIPPPWGMRKVTDLESWIKRGAMHGYWALVEAIGEVLRNVHLQEYAIREKITLDRQGQVDDGGYELQFFDIAEMMRACEEVRDDVRSFDPDVLYAPDARSGLWAERFFDYLQYRVPVVIGFKGEKNSIDGFWSYSDYYIPKFLIHVQKADRILLVFDRLYDSSEAEGLSWFLSRSLGVRKKNIKTLALVGTSAVAATMPVGQKSDWKAYLYLL